MARKGRVLHEAVILKVIHLLESTDMPMLDIAERMTCSGSAIRAINRKFGIRNYVGKRTIGRTASETTKEKS